MPIRVQDPKILPYTVLLHDYRVSTMFPFVFQTLFLALTNFLGKSIPNKLSLLQRK